MKTTAQKTAALLGSSRVFPQLSLGDWALLFFAALCLWAVFPGKGPNLAQLPPLPGWGLSCSHSAPVQPGAARSLAELCHLAVRTKNPREVYAREKFSDGWSDLDNDGCDTRQEVLARDFTHPRFDAAKPCRLVGGVLHDPYTGNIMSFTKPPGAKVQIDHVVALKDAWLSGAWKWNREQRRRYANDPGVLLAVDGPANQEKGADSIDLWQPENRAYRCAYARKQIDVKYRWALSVTASEKSALLRALETC